MNGMNEGRLFLRERKLKRKKKECRHFKEFKTVDTVVCERISHPKLIAFEHN